MTATDDPLVSTEWLAAHLGDANVKVLDATFKLPGALPLPKDDYLAAHLPGAVFFDVDAVSDHSNPLPHMFPSAEQFGRDIGGLGVSNADTVVIYDSGGWVAAPRAWWMFLSYGHRNVRILNGGLKKWRAEGRAVESGEVKPKPTTFRASYDPKCARHRARDTVARPQSLSRHPRPQLCLRSAPTRLTTPVARSTTRPSLRVTPRM